MNLWFEKICDVFLRIGAPSQCSLNRILGVPQVHRAARAPVGGGTTTTTTTTTKDYYY